MRAIDQHKRSLKLFGFFSVEGYRENGGFIRKIIGNYKLSFACTVESSKKLSAWSLESENILGITGWLKTHSVSRGCRFLPQSEFKEHSNTGYLGTEFSFKFIFRSKNHLFPI